MVGCLLKLLVVMVLLVRLLFGLCGIVVCLLFCVLVSSLCLFMVDFV